MTESRIPQNEVQGLPEDALYERVLDAAFKHEDTATSGQAMFIRVVAFIRDVDNGGITQALFNRDLSDTEQIIGDLEHIGAKNHATAIRDALRTLAGGNWPASDADLEAKLNRVSIDWIESNMTRYDEMLYYEEKLWPYFNQYLLANPNEFFLLE